MKRKKETEGMNALQKYKIHINGERTRLVVRSELRRFDKLLKYEIRRDDLMQKAINCKEPGITNDKLCNEQVVVSLTTYGRRLYDVAVTIESIMQGTMKPNLITLWLEDEMKDIELPLLLKNQQERGLKVLFCKNIRSYQKLLPAFGKYPDSCIITIDDDAIYEYDLVEKLVNAHKKHPKNVIANRLHRVVLGEDNRPIGYMRWDDEASPTDDSPLNFATGVGGVLYPPKCFPDEVMNEKVFMDICSHADDVWFYAMELMKGTRVIKCMTHEISGCDYVLNEFVQDMGLASYNTKAPIKGERADHCENDTQIKAVFDKYNLWDKLLEK